MSGQNSQTYRDFGSTISIYGPANANGSNSTTLGLTGGVATYLSASNLLTK